MGETSIEHTPAPLRTSALADRKATRNGAPLTLEPTERPPTGALGDVIAAMETRVRGLADELEHLQQDFRLELEAELGRAERVAPPRPRRLGLPRRTATLSRALSWLGVALLVAVGLVAAASWRSDLLWTAGRENLVLDSGFEATTLRWRPAGLRSHVRLAPELGRGGSHALAVRTTGAADGEGPSYLESSIRSGTGYTFSVFARSSGSAAVYPEIRWRAGDGSLLGAARGSVIALGRSWRRIDVSAVAPDRTTSALLVVGEAGGTPAPVTYVVDEAQLERASEAGSYVETGDQTGSPPGHPSDVAALLMLAVAGLIALASLRYAVLVVLPLSLAIPPSFANLDSQLPDITPTRALIIGCIVVAAARGTLRAPPRWILALGIVYSAVIAVALISDLTVVSTRLALSLTTGAFAPALLVLAVARVRRDIYVLVVSLAATAVVVSLGALAEWQLDRHLTPLYPGVIFDALARGGHVRARATFPHPIVLGTFLSMVLLPTVGLMVATRGLRRAVAGAAAVVIAAGLAVTLSRAPWLGAIVGVAALAALSGMWRRWRMIVVVGIALAAVVASPFGAPMRDSALGLVHPETEQERFVVQVRVDLAKRIGGHGVRTLVGSSLDPAEQPTFPTVIEGRKVDLASSIDNTYVRELIQTGLLGVLALTALLIAVLAETIRRARRAGGELRHVASGLAVAQLVVLLVGLTVGTISFSQVGTAFWLIAGAGIAIGRLHEHAADR